MLRILLKITVLGIIIGVGFSLNSCKRGTTKSKDRVKKPVVLQTDPNQGIYGGEWSFPEIEIVSSPDTTCQYAFSKQEQIIDYSVSPTGSFVAVLVEEDGQCDLKFWSIGSDEISDECTLPKNFKGENVVWHPQASALFVLGKENKEYQVYRIEKTSNDWTVEQIFSAKQKLKNMVVCPQPFIINYDYKTSKAFYAYRLFLGMDNGNDTYRIVSITEWGKRFYQVVGPKNMETKEIEGEELEFPTGGMESDWALPVAFHPAGHQLIWRDKKNNLFVATYKVREWGGSKPMKLPLKGKELLIPTPNGLGMISWQKNTSGIELFLIPTKYTSRQLTEYSFESEPVSVPDGKGIVGKTVKKGINILNYVPIDMPLPNVLNAWLFVNSEKDFDLFQTQYGLFRTTNFEQLYELYETENYDRNSITRPYLVTTDIFWELFAAAYQGVFIIKEREQAIPNFWKFVNEAKNYFKTNNETSKWNDVFTVLKDLKSNYTSNEEVLRILIEENNISEITGEMYAYSDLKPRGHYSSSPEMQLYFKAFRYFTTIFSDAENQDVLKELENLPSVISQYVINWIDSYLGFIAPSRSSLVWENLKTETPKYCQYPKREKVIFPLSWGFDNEVFYNTIYHEHIPVDKRIERLLPSGLDIAAVMGNGLADNLMADEYTKYPPLQKMIDNLRANYKTHSISADFKTNMYNQWLNAIAVQWADSVNTTSGKNGNNIWQVKRLQTGLATWVTLRHATVLVNERMAAECGEGGFEEIIMKTPRGSVEPDPYTFRAIANLFQEVSKTTSKLKSDMAGTQAVYDGLVKRLEDAKQETLLFASIAEKERKGEKLSNEEYKKIYEVARVAEHLLLVFRSLNDDYGLSTPEPMSKIADVAGDGNISPYLMAAVGNPMEWNYIVPYYGRFQIVKGSVYSYYEFESAELINDEEWRKRKNKQEILPWIKPFIVSNSTTWEKDTGY